MLLGEEAAACCIPLCLWLSHHSVLALPTGIQPPITVSPGQPRGRSNGHHSQIHQQLFLPGNPEAMVMGCVARVRPSHHPSLWPKRGWPLACLALPSSPCCIRAFTLPCSSPAALQPCRPACGVSATSWQAPRASHRHPRPPTGVPRRLQGHPWPPSAMAGTGKRVVRKAPVGWDEVCAPWAGDGVAAQPWSSFSK